MIFERSFEPLTAGRIIAVASGKGGVGKTVISVSLARAFSQQGERTLLVDADLGMANIDVQLGLQPRGDIASVVNGKMSLEEAACPALGGAQERGGFDVISGRSGSGALASLSGPSLSRLATSIAALALSYDRAVLDLAAGADKATLRMALAADDLILVINDEPTSLTDAYAFMKSLRLHDPCCAPMIVVNNAPSMKAAQHAFAAFKKTCEVFLSFSPTLAGVVRRDPHVPVAIRAQTALAVRSPTCEAAKDMDQIAGALAKGREAA